jgi:hypothetical protein
MGASVCVVVCYVEYVVFLFIPYARYSGQMKSSKKSWLQDLDFHKKDYEVVSRSVYFHLFDCEPGYLLLTY